MRGFLTGGTGQVGSGIARALLSGGHDVVGLARSPAAADRLHAAGVEPVRGDLADADVLRRGGAIRVDARRARTVLHWRPRGPDLLDDIEHGSYRPLAEEAPPPGPTMPTANM